jgi:tetratricopeptide (TPR) repeat protein
MMKTIFQRISILFAFSAVIGCQSNKEAGLIQQELQAINISRGEIALCGTNQFGEVKFALSCDEKVRADFNLATALLHSFEYVEAEKVFAKVIDGDPNCLMAYWGVAMSNYHPLWAPPTTDELTKGSKTINLARKLASNSSRETEYIEAVATVFDKWDSLDHKTRVEKFVNAAQSIYSKYPEDKEAAIFYALALRASADPADKTFTKQKMAGEILGSIFPNEPNHPGVAHYIIHNYDYPELADQGLDAARKYASIASNSAHAQHMPSHIFTRLGLWDESIQSNLNSMDAAKCYTENLGKQGHWDQELHGLDYLVYAYLQQSRDEDAKLQVEYLASIDSVFPLTFVNAYTFAAAPVRYALERKDWKQAASLELRPTSFPWEKFQWQKGIHHFGRLLGAVNLNDLKMADVQLAELKKIESFLKENKKDYEANQTRIQIAASEASILFAKGKKKDAVTAMIAAVEMENATEKHSVTPGEVVPTLELLGDMYMKLGEYKKAAEAYVADLKIRPGRYNSVYGAALASNKAGDRANAKLYYDQLLELTKASKKTRPELAEAGKFIASSSI